MHLYLFVVVVDEFIESYCLLEYCLTSLGLKEIENAQTKENYVSILSKSQLNSLIDNYF